MIPLHELRDACQLDSDNLGHDDYLVRLERAAVAHVERITGRYFGPPAARTEYLVGAGQRELLLADTPIATGDPAEVVVAVTRDGTAVETTEWEVRGDHLRHTAAWGAGRYPVDLVVQYTAGYAVIPPDDDYEDDPIQELDVPADVRQAVTMLVAHWFENRIPVALGTVAPEIDVTLRALLQPLKRIAV